MKKMKKVRQMQLKKAKTNHAPQKQKLKIELTLEYKLRTPVSGLPTYFMI
jgi:hypothetical protein